MRYTANERRVLTPTGVAHFAPIFVANAKSRRAAEKMGLAFEGVRSAAVHRGRRWDEVVSAILRTDV
jgi:RimJ/RimL family protein N-acetyltransferase